LLETLTLIGAVAFAYALVSRRLASTVLTAPIFFAGAGFVAGPVLGVVDVGPRDEVLVLQVEARHPSRTSSCSRSP